MPMDALIAYFWWHKSGYSHLQIVNLQGENIHGTRPVAQARWELAHVMSIPPLITAREFATEWYDWMRANGRHELIVYSSH